MDKNIKIIISIVLAVAVMASVYLVIYFNHQNKLSACMEKCFYISQKNTADAPTGRDAASIVRFQDKGDYWKYENREFETQKQCLDYCLTK